MKMDENKDKYKLSPKEDYFYHYACGRILQSKNQMDAALDCFNRVLELEPQDHKTYYIRSLLHRDLAHEKDSLNDAIKAREFLPSIKTSIRYCDAIHMTNDFENTKRELHNYSLMFAKQNIQKFEHQLNIVDGNFYDTIGPSVTPFFIHNASRLSEVHKKVKQLEFIDPRQPWKIKRDDGKCDVTSIAPEDKEILSPLEEAKRGRLYKVFNQIYYQKSWIDMDFLKSLKTNDIFSLPQTKWSTPILKKQLQVQYGTAYRFMRTLHKRSPMYNELDKRNSKKSNSYYYFQQSSLNNIQYQTRRECQIILQTVIKLRKEKQTVKLIDYVEEVMSNYISRKTSRILPWKFEFLNEIYNLVALALCDQLKIPKFAFESSRTCQLILYNLKTEGASMKRFIFGKRSTYDEPDKPDTKYIRYKNRLKELEYRLRFSKLPIERAYINHEIGRCHLSQGKFHECKTVAKRTVEEANACGSHIWSFLGNLQLCKPFIIGQKIELLKRALEYLDIAAKGLHDKKLHDFVKLCKQLNNEDLSEKKNLRKLSTKLSSHSHF